MKTTTFPKYGFIVSLMMVFLFITMNSVKSQQTWTSIPKIGAPQVASQITQYESTQTNIGIGAAFMPVPLPNYPTAVGAKLHILGTGGLISYPLLRIESPTDGYINFLYQENFNSPKYGIFQNGSSTGINFFSYKVGIGVLNPTHTLDVAGTGNFTGNISTKGNLVLSHDMNDGQILTLPSIASLNGIEFWVTGANPTGPIMTLSADINNHVLLLDGLLNTNKFQLRDQKGANKLLVSDADGNGNWTNSPWGLNGNDMFTNNQYYSINNVQVNTNSNKTVLGSFSGLNNATGYFGLNAIRGNSSWNISSNGQNNGGNIIWGDINGNLRFSNIMATVTGGDADQHPVDNDIYNNTKLLITNDGRVAIGIKDPQTKYQNYLLAVNGKIICEELKVRLYAQWGDYILKNDYKLTPLKDLETYIIKNQHLPGIPSAKEIEEQGLSLGEMNCVLVKKVEELTKYLIEQQKQIDELKQHIDNR